MSNNLFSSELLLGIFQIFSEYTCIYCCCLGTKSCLTLCDPMDYSRQPPLVHGILQARILDWIAISDSRGSSQPRDQTRVSYIAGRVFTIWATREARWLSLWIYIYNWCHCQLSGLLFSSPWTAALFWDSWPLLHLTPLPHLTVRTMMHCMFHIFETWYLSFSQGWMNRIYILILSGPGILIFRNLLILQGTDF